jgi:hypothetical protein
MLSAHQAPDSLRSWQKINLAMIKSLRERLRDISAKVVRKILSGLTVIAA